jgi:hypothetical protein
MLRIHLADADPQVDRGLQRIKSQGAVVAELERDGQDATTAKELVAMLLRSQELHVTHRDTRARRARRSKLMNPRRTRRVHIRDVRQIITL